MNATRLAVPDVIVFEPFGDDRGFLFESFKHKVFVQAVGRSVQCAQDNLSRSVKRVKRGLHYQVYQPHGKLDLVSQGEVFDFAVGMRKSSSTFQKWAKSHLTNENRKQLWVPDGFAHGFFVLFQSAELIYRTTDYWTPEHERSLAWNDTTVTIESPLSKPPTVSVTDQQALIFENVEVFAE